MASKQNAVEESVLNEGMKEYNAALLISAIKKRNLSLVKEALEAGVDPNEPCSVEDCLEFFGVLEVGEKNYTGIGGSYTQARHYDRYPLAQALSFPYSTNSIIDLLFEYGAKISKIPDQYERVIYSDAVSLKHICEDEGITDINRIQSYDEDGFFHTEGPSFDFSNIEKSNFFFNNANVTSFMKDKIRNFYQHGSVFEQEGLESNVTALTELAVKNFHAPISEELKIPRKLHHIWLTHSDSPKELRQEDMGNIVRINNEILQKTGYSYEHIVWVNDKNLIPESVKFLQSKDILVKEMDSLIDCSLCGLIEEKISEKLWGMASDMLRVEIVKQEGGLYMDLNYVLIRSLEPEMHKFDFFSQSFGSLYIDNFFFCSKPNHPIINEWINNIYQKFNNPLPYIQKIINSGDTDHMTDTMTANPSFVAYYKASNRGDNIDFLFPKNCQSFRISDRGVIVRYEVGEKYKFTNDQICLEHQYLRPLFEHQDLDSTALDFDVHDSYEVPHCLEEDLLFGQDGTNGRTWVADAE